MTADQSVSLGEHYLQVVVEKFLGLKSVTERTFDQLREDEWNWSMNADSNSIATIVKHMSGNMISRWTDFLTSDGEKPNRNRDCEFEDEDNTLTRNRLLNVWDQGWDVFLEALGELRPEHLQHTVFIRQQPHTVLQAIERQLSHYAYHVGQIIYIAKLLRADEWSSLTIPRRK
ncbi:DUF1572 domain-containing protein [Paenibacillus sp. ACRRX]|uniref:DUF1572 family protein n=1 Tax=Paenibacillus sp. ACRRX TaxID=2918206 RepID=UPI001EF723CD|nr:DUF1572 family protein [Paenibacillus sp. ACRRX]MCG7407308.1 DUF1572 domain-containing protein [Paenibacillus sp. ACRRX]